MSRSTPFHPAPGGMEEAFWSLAVALRQKSIAEVDVVTTSLRSPASFSHKGVRVIPAPSAPSGRYSRQWWSYTSRLDVSEYDAIVSVSAAATALLATRRPRPPVIIQCHGTARAELRSASQSWDVPSLARNARLLAWTFVDAVNFLSADAVVSIGPAVTNGLQEAPYGHLWAHTRLVEIPNVVRALSATDRDRSRAATHTLVPHVLCAGRLVAQKGFDRVIRGMVGGRFRLTIAGDGPDREKLESLAEYLGVSDRIAFLGHITNQELRVLMSAVDATVFLPHSLHREGLPMVVLESLALNVPVVTLDGPLWPDDVRDELQFVDPEAPDSLRQLLDSAILLAKPTLPSRFTEEAVVTEWSKLLLGVKER